MKKIDRVFIIALAAVASAAYPRQAIFIAEAVGGVLLVALMMFGFLWGFLFAMEPLSKLFQTKPVLALEEWTRQLDERHPRLAYLVIGAVMFGFLFGFGAYMSILDSAFYLIRDDLLPPVPLWLQRFAERLGHGTRDW
jgi:hypothetical protein